MFGLDALSSKDPNDVYDNFVNIVLDIYNVYAFHIRKFVLSKNKMSGFTLHYKKCIKRKIFYIGNIWKIQLNTVKMYMWPIKINTRMQ